MLCLTQLVHFSLQNPSLHISFQWRLFTRVISVQQSGWIYDLRSNMIARGLNGQLLSSQSNFQVPFFKKRKKTIGHIVCTAWLQQSYSQSATIQTQSTMFCYGATQNSSPITNTITSDCFSCLHWSLSKKMLALCVGAWFRRHNSRDAF